MTTYQDSNVTTAMKYTVAMVMGRFQPYHNGHAALIMRALELAPTVVVVLGSAFAAPNAKNPFTWEERAAMIRATLDKETAARIRFVPMRDYYDDGKWCAAVEKTVAQFADRSNKVVLVGHLKDASSYYLKRFPTWTLESVPPFGAIDATGVRQIMFEVESWPAQRALLSQLVPAAIAEYLHGWSMLPLFAKLKAAHTWLGEYQRQWGTGPFVTGDAVVTAAGHVLLIRRREGAGTGLWALPGGFLESRERVYQCAVRDLYEETGLALLDSTLERALRESAVFDHADRSLRARIITHAHHFDLGDCRLPDIKGADDALEARWVALEDLPAMESQFFEDHFIILDHFLKLLA